MRILLKKGSDSPSTLSCVRDDGSRTWSKLHDFFPVHDLTHYAVETVLAFREAFFGLLASGWEIDSFEKREWRLRMPVEAVWAEHIVGLLDRERGMGLILSREEFNESLREALKHGETAAFRVITDDELARIRALRSKLQALWHALGPGESLELNCPAAG
jgi:hypothetical protein